jgi:signal peptidase II
VLVGLLVLAADQGSKRWAAAALQPGHEVTIISGWLWFRLASNTGASLGLFSGHSELIGIVSVLVVVALVALAVRTAAGGRIGLLALAAVTGGALSNLLDRVRLGGVIDFIEVHLWPTDFNLADAAIRLGVVCFLLALVRQGISGRRQLGRRPAGRG